MGWAGNGAENLAREDLYCTYIPLRLMVTNPCCVYGLLLPRALEGVPEVLSLEMAGQNRSLESQFRWCL